MLGKVQYLSVEVYEVKQNCGRLGCRFCAKKFPPEQVLPQWEELSERSVDRRMSEKLSHHQ